MVSDRLDALIRGRIERTYLQRNDGYWADLVLEEFAFLEERSGRLTEVTFHQKGDYVRYDGPWGVVILEFAPDNFPQGEWISGSANLRGDRAAFRGQLDVLLRERQPGTPPPSSATLDRPTIAASVRAWAECLRSASDLFEPRSTPDG